MTQARRILMWASIAALATILGYFSFRAYFTPELLLHFSSGFHC
jgi:hypothetical protein